MRNIYEFKDEERGIRIYEPQLPQPWINYLSNGTLHAFVSQAGGGFAWWRSPLKFRLTRYRLYNLPIDSPGFYVYLREADGSFWSPTWRPVEAGLDEWYAEHRPGITKFYAQREGLAASLEFWIPPRENVLVWDLRIKVLEEEPREVDVFAYVELSLLDWRQDTEWSCYVKHNLETFFCEKANALVYLYRHFHFNPLLHECPLTFLGASHPVSTWCGERDVFTGFYRDERNPEAVESGKCANVGTLCGDPCGALHVKVRVDSQKEQVLHFFLGCEERAVVDWPRALSNAQATMKRLQQISYISELKEDLEQWWEEHLGVLQFELPDADIARQVNIWSPVQSVHTGRYSRSVSQNASGTRTMGFRDTCQDMLAISYRKTEWAKEVFIYLLSQQYEDGHVPHQCNPLEKLPAEPRIHIDNPLWLPLLAKALLAETGDTGLLEIEVPWLSNKDNLSPVGKATVWEHLLRICEFIEANLGTHGIPLTHHGDWNDSIGKFSKRGKGESLMAAMQYVYILDLLISFSKLLLDNSAQERLLRYREKQVSAILECGWDGNWWRRGYDDDGNPIGSARCEFGKIWLNTQTWAVIAGIGSLEQQVKAMDSVAELLDTNLCGIKKLHPSFPSFPQVADPYSGYSPGCGENGAIFCHANTWAIIAEALLERPQKAWHYYRQLVPHLALQKLGLHRYRAEPYAYVSNIIGPENPKYGWANVTQVTGTATWMDIAATQYLLGLRPEIDGLRIVPCLPPSWSGFQGKRIFRGCCLEIEVRRTGRDRLEIDGTKFEGDMVPAPSLVGQKCLRVLREIT
ncbi:MAG: hypothetical protein N2035_08290 [Chthoniobacterales bacterium]|nr:hypothetical protein [Chthoniobacterales bacterium]